MGHAESPATPPCPHFGARRSLQCHAVALHPACRKACWRALRLEAVPRSLGLLAFTLPLGTQEYSRVPFAELPQGAPVTRRRGCMCHPARRPLMSPIHHTHTRRRPLPRQRTLSTAINSSTAHRPPAPPVASTPSLHPLSLERLSPGRPSSPPAMSSRAVAAGRRGAQTRRSQSS